MVQLVRVTTRTEMDGVRQLFLEYADTLDFDLKFQKFTTEMSSLPGDYASPRGAMILALDNDETVGCVALRPLDSEVCEMKRLYVRSGCRGKGFGGMLAKAIVSDARQRGYERMRLDTVPSMKTARRLYESMGFKRIPAYRHNPVPGAMFFELELTRTGSTPPRERTQA